MTADWADLDQELLRRISNRIINEVRRHQPRRARHLEQAAGYDRVGMRRLSLTQWILISMVLGTLHRLGVPRKPRSSSARSRRSSCA